MKVLAVAVHPDDETLGCGGTLLKHARAGDTLHWLLITAMHAEHDYSAWDIDNQERQVRAVQESYPFTTLDWLRLPTTRLEMLSLNEIIIAIERGVERVRPDIVYVPHWSDSHSDHRVIFDAMLGVLKSFYMTKHGVSRILSCEVISETDAAAALARFPFTPNVFVDISDTIEQKLEIFSLFKTEVHADPGPRSLSAIRALARMRGATVGVSYAESFMMVREIVNMTSVDLAE